jgi:hypothetical protein
MMGISSKWKLKLKLLGIILGTLLLILLQAYYSVNSPLWGESKNTELRIVAYKEEKGPDIKLDECNPIKLNQLTDAYIKSLNLNYDYELSSVAVESMRKNNKVYAKWQIRGVEIENGFWLVGLCLIISLIIGLAGAKIQELYKNIKNVQGDSEFEQKTSLLIAEHPWVLSYGLSKIYTDLTTPRQHYYESLEIISNGFEVYCANGTGPLQPGEIKITLFCPDAIDRMYHLHEKDNAKFHLRRLYNRWNVLAKNPLYTINRAFICNEAVFHKCLNEITDEGVTYEEWYKKICPDIPCCPLDPDEDEIKEQIKSLGVDKDFAIFTCRDKKLCAGFVGLKLAYVILGGDNLGVREQLYETFKNILSEHEIV